MLDYVYYTLSPQSLTKVPEATTKRFLLQKPTDTAFKLLDVADQSIVDQDLVNSKIIMVWDE